MVLRIVWDVIIVIRGVKIVIRMFEMIEMKVFIVDISRYKFNWMNKVSPTWDALRFCFFGFVISFVIIKPLQDKYLCPERTYCGSERCDGL